MNAMALVRKNRLLVLVALVYGGIFLVTPAMARQSVQNSVYYLREMLLVLPVIFLFTVVIEALIPKEMIIRGFGEKSGFMGNILALLLGSISAGPIYAAFPVSKALLNKGASVGNIVIILSAWAVVKVPMLANEVKFLGPQFMAVRWVLTVAAIMVMAYLTGVLVKKDDLNPEADGSFQPKLTIEPAYCIGCGICTNLLPQCFTMEGEKAVVTQIPQAPQAAERLQETADKCPGKAITYHA
jgi:uncharacterized membrane protein YraQ (UPF0718 family)